MLTLPFPIPLPIFFKNNISANMHTPVDRVKAAVGLRANLIPYENRRSDAIFELLLWHLSALHMQGSQTHLSGQLKAYGQSKSHMEPTPGDYEWRSD